MATKLQRALIFALVAVGSFAVCPVNAEESQQLIASLPGSTVNTDPVIDRAMDIIRQSREAEQKVIRRHDYIPSFDEKIVRSHRNPNHVYILGGAAALPM
jgi:hypothetical protein